MYRRLVRSARTSRRDSSARKNPDSRAGRSCRFSRRCLGRNRAFIPCERSISGSHHGDEWLIGPNHRQLISHQEFTATAEKSLEWPLTASLTITFGCPKVGLYLGEAINQAGTIVVSDIGIPLEYMRELSANVHLLTPQMIKPLLPQRSRASHKGTYGHAGIIAGSPGKTGAAALAGKSALRIGTGLVTVATPKTMNPTLEAQLLEAMTAPMPETDECTLGLSALFLLE